MNLQEQISEAMKLADLSLGVMVVPFDHGFVGGVETKKSGLLVVKNHGDSDSLVVHRIMTVVETLRKAILKSIAAMGPAPEGYQVAYLENWPISVIAQPNGEFKVDQRGAPAFLRQGFSPAARVATLTEIERAIFVEAPNI